MFNWQFVMFTIGMILLGCTITFVGAFIWYKQRRKVKSILDEVDAIIAWNANAELAERCMKKYPAAMYSVYTFEMPNGDLVVESGYNVPERKTHEMLRNASVVTITQNG